MSALEFVGRFLEPYPREVYLKDSGIRKPITHPQDLKDLLFSFDVFYSTRSLVDYLLGLWDRIFLDVDAHNGRDMDIAKLQTQAVIAELKEAGIEPVVIYSGRGYHIYILLSEPVQLNLAAVKRWASERGMDGNVINNNPMARLPYTFNSRSLTMAVPVSWADLETESLDMPKNSPHLLGQIFGQDLIEETKEVSRMPIEWEDILPLCLQRMIAQLVITGNLDHMARFTLANFLLRAYGYEAASRVFQLASDYKPRETEYQLRHIKRNRYVMPSCSTIQSLGYCEPETQCPFKPWLEPYLRGWQ